MAQAAVEEYREIDEKYEETVLPSYDQLLKAKGFTILVSMGVLIVKNPGVLTGMQCLNLVSDAYILMTCLYL